MFDELVLDLEAVEALDQVYYCPDTDIVPPEVRRMKARTPIPSK